VAAVGTDHPSGPQVLGSGCAGQADVDAVVGLVQTGQADAALDEDAREAACRVRSRSVSDWGRFKIRWYRDATSVPIQTRSFADWPANVSRAVCGQATASNSASTPIAASASWERG
jgi:hypothetical protein